MKLNQSSYVQLVYQYFYLVLDVVVCNILYFKMEYQKLMQGQREDETKGIMETSTTLQHFSSRQREREREREYVMSYLTTQNILAAAAVSSSSSSSSRDLKKDKANM